MENQNPDELPPIVTGLYRIPNEVLNEIINALRMWQNFSSTQDQILVEMAWNCIKKPYSTTNEPNPINKINQINNKPLTLGQNNQLKNSIQDFKSFLDAMADQAQGDYKESLKRIQLAFQSSIETNL